MFPKKISGSQNETEAQAEKNEFKQFQRGKGRKAKRHGRKSGRK
jgi:hypothetical protein